MPAHSISSSPELHDPGSIEEEYEHWRNLKFFFAKGQEDYRYIRFLFPLPELSLGIN